MRDEIIHRGWNTQSERAFFFLLHRFDDLDYFEKMERERAHRAVIGICCTMVRSLRATLYTYARLLYGHLYIGHDTILDTTYFYRSLENTDSAGTYETRNRRYEFPSLYEILQTIPRRFLRCIYY